MKYFCLSKSAVFFFLMLLFFSCTPKKNILYYQNIDSMASAKLNSYEIRIQPDDLLQINISAEDPKVTAPFNLNPVNVVGNEGQGQVGGNKSVINDYLVDADGYINFPELGKLKLGGLTRTEVLALFQKKLGAYIKDPIITVRIQNFKVAVQGEVNGASIIKVQSDRITLIEALTQAGDLKTTANRKNILVIREIDGVKSFFRVDVTKSDFINSPYYYLAQNDVIYVEPKNRTISPDVTLVTTISSLLVTFVSFLLVIAK
ncbi:polysaccharide export outer membrane protein [Flavobacterium glycines]|uniref:Polysaccharide export outer membrane protein n=2 Tax=Flavobacterium glycines TaxID=551990 RepID=A0A1B9DH85_9FLAO|nr:polysaccharide biosynthesis/export family protein [Flavobacterium glycines]OCB69074.1 sugar transporter [Flavobacterium glycines]SDJ53760.1 polysaccharide export outer membrane protein [Flavobacterium glycines]